MKRFQNPYIIPTKSLHYPFKIPRKQFRKGYISCDFFCDRLVTLSRRSGVLYNDAQLKTTHCCVTQNVTMLQGCDKEVQCSETQHLTTGTLCKATQLDCDQTGLNNLKVQRNEVQHRAAHCNVTRHSAVPYHSHTVTSVTRASALLFLEWEARDNKLLPTTSTLGKGGMSGDTAPMGRLVDQVMDILELPVDQQIRLRLASHPSPPCASPTEKQGLRVHVSYVGDIEIGSNSRDTRKWWIASLDDTSLFAGQSEGRSPSAPTPEEGGRRHVSSVLTASVVEILEFVTAFSPVQLEVTTSIIEVASVFSDTPTVRQELTASVVEVLEGCWQSHGIRRSYGCCSVPFPPRVIVFYTDALALRRLHDRVRRGTVWTPTIASLLLRSHQVLLRCDRSSPP